MKILYAAPARVLEEIKMGPSVLIPKSPIWLPGLKELTNLLMLAFSVLTEGSERNITYTGANA